MTAISLGQDIARAAILRRPERRSRRQSGWQSLRNLTGHKGTTRDASILANDFRFVAGARWHRFWIRARPSARAAATGGKPRSDGGFASHSAAAGAAG